MKHDVSFFFFSLTGRHFLNFIDYAASSVMLIMRYE